MKAKNYLPVVMALAGFPAFAEPLSAVDWLSKSLEATQDVAPETPLIGVLTETIATTSLSDVQKDTVGLLPSQISGIPSNFWGDSSVNRLAALIRNAPMGQLPEITAMWRRIVLAEIDPPVGMTEKNTLLLARLDNLLNAGALDPAGALLKAADPSNPELFRRWFDVSILTQRAENACARMVSTPNFAPTLQARVFCLARAGDWSAASVTYTTGKALGAFSNDEALLLDMFLDPQNYDNATDPPLPPVLTPLAFVMREALGLPRPAQTLPLAFLHFDLQNNAGWKQRITSAERLVRERAIPLATLLDLYLEGAPSASGGVWERVAAVQSLNGALGADDDEKLSDSLIKANQVMAPLGLQAALSEWFTPALEGRELSMQAKRIGFKLAAINPNSNDLAQSLATSHQIDRFVASILSGSFNTPPKGDMQLAISNALSGQSAKTVLHQTIDDGRLGEAVLSALILLRNGAETDAGDIEVALSVLAYGGFKTEAEKIASQLLLLGKNA
jgi:hypothetical protein